MPLRRLRGYLPLATAGFSGDTGSDDALGGSRHFAAAASRRVRIDFRPLDAAAYMPPAAPSAACADARGRSVKYRRASARFFMMHLLPILTRRRYG